MNLLKEDTENLRNEITKINAFSHVTNIYKVTIS